MPSNDAPEVPHVVRSPLATSFLVGFNWAVLIDLGLMLVFAFVPISLTWEVRS